MPTIIAQETLADGLKITVSGASPPTVFIVTSADLPANIKSGTTAACATFVNNLLATQLAGRDFAAVVRVRQVVPLLIDLATGPIGMTQFPSRG